MFCIKSISRIVLKNKASFRPSFRFLSQKSNTSIASSGKATIAPPSLKGLNKSILSTLLKEIKEEEKYVEKVVPPKDWTLEIVGNNAVLTRTMETESIKVTFDILATEKFPFTEEEDPIEEREDTEAALPQFACIPELIVEISRSGKGKIQFTLNYEEEEDPESPAYEDTDEVDELAYDGSNEVNKPHKYDEDHPLSFKVKHNMWVDINDVAYFNNDGKLVYKFSSDLFDFEFGYSMIEFLAIRGVNVEFLNDVMDLASKVDHESYVKFLNGFKQYLSE